MKTLTKTVVYTVAGLAFLTALGAVGNNDMEAAAAEQQIQYLQEENMRQSGKQQEKQMSTDYLQGVKDSAYLICNNSRLNYPNYTEDVCATFLEENALDFQCDTRDSNPETYCWVTDLVEGKE